MIAVVNILLSLCLTCRYRWAESASYLYVDVFPPKSTVYTVTDLKPSTMYNFSVNAINSMGESSYADNGAVLTITTNGQYEALLWGFRVESVPSFNIIPTSWCVLICSGEKFDFICIQETVLS